METYWRMLLLSKLFQVKYNLARREEHDCSRQQEVFWRLKVRLGFWECL